jgi:hypothetical protein
MSTSSLAAPENTTTSQEEEQQSQRQQQAKSTPLVLEDLGKTVDEDNNGTCVICSMVEHQWVGRSTHPRLTRGSPNYACPSSLHPSHGWHPF